MALINCEECGKEISDRAFACPNCGCPTSNGNNIAAYTQKVFQSSNEQTSSEQSSEQDTRPDNTFYDTEYKKDSKLAIIGCIFDLVSFFFFGFLAFVGLVCGLVDITSDDTRYRHIFGWVSLTAGTVLFLTWFLNFTLS